MRELSAVSTLRLSPHPPLSRARQLSHEPWPGIPAVAGRRPAVAAQASEEARRCCSATTAGALRAEPGVVLRFRVRPLCQWSAAQVSDGNRRVHQGGTSDRPRWPHPLATCDRSPGATGQRARRTGLPAQRQRPGVRVEGDLVLGGLARDQHRIDRLRQALAEWRHGKLQRQVS
jgi:hypothetical protein